MKHDISVVKLFQIAGAGLLISFCVALSNGLPAQDSASNSVKPAATSLPLYQAIGLADAIKTFNDAKALIVDARPAVFYEAGHIQHAINISAADLNGNSSLLNSNAASLKQASVVMVYCSSSCGAAGQVATALSKAGAANVTVYGEGWPEWEACRLPSTRGEKTSAQASR